jgi:hypothetical protein
LQIRDRQTDELTRKFEQERERFPKGGLSFAIGPAGGIRWTRLSGKGRDKREATAIRLVAGVVAPAAVDVKGFFTT